MPVESATYINQLNSSYPGGSEAKSQGDDHLRLIKAVLLATFPNLSGAVSLTQSQINALFNGGVDIPGNLVFTGNKTHNGTDVFTDLSTAIAKLTGTFLISGIISPAQITADQNDYNPTGLSTASILRLSTDANGGLGRAITGLAGGASGRIVTILNVDANLITLKDENAGSTAANRFALLGDVVLLPDESVELWYDATSSRWRIKSRFQNDNRTWTDVIGSRSAATNYQNTTGRAIVVSVRATPNSPIAAPGSINAYVGSANPASINMDANLGHGDGAGSPKTFYGGVTIVVPHLWWYRIEIAGYSIGTWAELR